jgi:hypothetical protein
VVPAVRSQPVDALGTHLGALAHGRALSQVMGSNDHRRAER